MDISAIIPHNGNGTIVRMRDVRCMRLDELLMRSSDYPAGKRPPVIIDGEAIEETLRERLTREVHELEEAMIALAEKHRDRQKQLELLARFPIDDPCVNGDVITFEKTFPGTPSGKYAYAATRVDGLWYVTGSRSPHAVTWTGLINWMGLGVRKVYKLDTGKGRKKIIG